jgi:hypothetical protein
MTETIISQDDLERIVRRDAEIIIGAGTGHAGELAAQRLFEEFRQQWQPRLQDKDYTALFNTYSNWVVADVSNHYKPGSATRNPPVTSGSILDGDEIPRPDAAPMSEGELASLLEQAKSMAEAAASEIASTTRNGGDGNKVLQDRLNAFLRFAATHKPTEDEGERLIKAFQDALRPALQRELDSKNGTSPESPPKPGCLGAVALIALMPVIASLSWAYA